MLDADRIQSRVKTILSDSIIKIYHVSDQFLVLDPASIILCAKINMQVDLIGPYPRHLTSDKTSLPGLITSYQADILRYASENVHFFNGERFLSDEEQVENDRLYDDIYQYVEKEVTRKHSQIAQNYGQTVDIDDVMNNFGHVKKDKLRWRINFLEDAISIDERIKTPKMPSSFDDKRSACHAALWHAGLFLTSGIKYGCDWLAYSGSPEIYHAIYIVFVVDIDRQLRASDISSLSRIATKNRKRLMLLSIDNRADNDMSSSDDDHHSKSATWRVCSTEITWSQRTS